MKQGDREKYWNGSSNKLIRYYFYTQRGLALLNEMRYLIMAILAIYAILKLDGWWWMPVMFFGSLPVLGVLGWVSVHKMSSVMEFLGIEFGTHFGKYSVELQEKQVEVQERTLAVLERLDKSEKT